MSLNQSRITLSYAIFLDMVGSWIPLQNSFFVMAAGFFFMGSSSNSRSSNAVLSLSLMRRKLVEHRWTMRISLLADWRNWKDGSGSPGPIGHCPDTCSQPEGHEPLQQWNWLICRNQAQGPLSSSLRSLRGLRACWLSQVFRRSQRVNAASRPEELFSRWDDVYASLVRLFAWTFAHKGQHWVPG